MRGLRIALGLVGVFGLAATAAADQAIYVGGGVGMYDVTVDGPGGNGNGNFDDSATLWRAFAGYQINKYISIQGDYQWYGNAQDTVPPGTRNQFQVDGNAWEVSVRPSYPINDRFEIFGRLGWNWYEVNVEQRARFGQPTLGKQSNSDDAMMYSAGLAFHFTPAFSVAGEYEIVNVDDGDLSSWSLNFVYKFPR